MEYVVTAVHIPGDEVVAECLGWRSVRLET